jgi:hypothetical protein
LQVLYAIDGVSCTRIHRRGIPIALAPRGSARVVRHLNEAVIRRVIGERAIMHKQSHQANSRQLLEV